MEAVTADAKAKLKLISTVRNIVGGKRRSVSMEEARKLGIIK